MTKIDCIHTYIKEINEYSVITYMINSYLIGGFDNMLIYELERNTKIDTAYQKRFLIWYTTYFVMN